MSDEAMRVAWPAVLRRLTQNGHDGVYIIVKVPGVKGSPDALLADVQAAMDRANAAMDRDGGELVWAQHVIPSVKGPMVDLDWIGTDEQTQEWLGVFAEELARRGRAGQVTAAPQARFPADFDGYFIQPRLTCYLALTVEDPSGYFAPGPGRWLGKEDLTRDLCRFAVEWGPMPGAATYLSESTSEVLIGDPRPAEALLAGVTRSAQAGVMYLLSQPYRTRSVEFLSGARVAFQAAADSRGAATPDWRGQAEAVTGALLRLPERLDYGLIRPAAGFGFGSKTPTDPYVRDGLYDLNRHMWSQYVQDAHGSQLLTRQHLERAHDLSAWQVTEVARGRFLVKAADLAPWWDSYTPDPDVLAQARSDFGDMIMTLADIEADPHGWLPGRGRAGK
jgi:hypothetical protein